MTTNISDEAESIELMSQATHKIHRLSVHWTKLFFVDFQIRHIEDYHTPGACYKFDDGDELNSTGSLAKLKLKRDAILDEILETIK